MFNYFLSFATFWQKNNNITIHIKNTSLVRNVCGLVAKQQIQLFSHVGTCT